MFRLKKLTTVTCDKCQSLPRPSTQIPAISEITYTRLLLVKVEAIVTYGSQCYITAANF